MKTAKIAPEELASATDGTLIEDRYGDRGVRLGDGYWLFTETAPLTSQYVAKHYAPFKIIHFEPGDTITLAEEAMSVPLDTVVETPQKRRYRKTGPDAWAHVGTEGPLVSSEELTSGRMRLRILP